MYNVHTMKHLKVAEARARFGEILDEAEKGTPVVIERRGVRFRLVADVEPRKATVKSGLFEKVDPVLIAGQWSWNAGAAGLRFAPRRKAR